MAALAVAVVQHLQALFLLLRWLRAQELVVKVFLEALVLNTAEAEAVELVA